MSETHVVSALKEKRAEIAGLVAHHERLAAQHRSNLAFVDGTLRLFAPEIEPEAIPAKAHREYDRRFGNGELARLIRDTMRRLAKPVSVGNLAEAIMASKGLDVGAADEMASVKKSIQQTLRKFEKSGEMKSAAIADGSVLWEVA